MSERVVSDEIMIICEAVRRAQELARKSGLAIGQRVAHPSDRMTYELIAISGNDATVGIDAIKSPSGKKIQKHFPLNELFHPDDAMRLMNQTIEDKLSKIPNLEVV